MIFTDLFTANAVHWLCVILNLIQDLNTVCGKIPNQVRNDVFFYSSILEKYHADFEVIIFVTSKNG